jgi:hypothetical protein
MSWSSRAAVALADTIRLCGHRIGVRPSGPTRFPFDGVGVASLAAAGLFLAIAVLIGTVRW